MLETKAVLLTDVVDSTQLGESLGDAKLASLWAAHDRLARDLLRTWRGREIDKTDGFLLLFDEAGDAIGYALDYHRALASLDVPLRARAGLHVGPVILRTNSSQDVLLGAKPVELDGMAKPLAARVMSLARGGQTLLSAEACEALAETEWQVQSCGHWRLKGIARPVELYEAGAAEATFTPPSDSEKAYRVVWKDDLWLPVRHIENNLPQQLGRFVGRERELADLLQQMTQTRMLTLFGSGGIGKTRLCNQIAAASLGDFPDGVWIVELGSLSNPRLVTQTIATTLGLKEAAATPIARTLVDHLQDKRTLLILDNCEHLLDSSAKTAEEILKRCPGVTLLASSREVLGIPGEQKHRVSSLSHPATKEVHTPQSIAQYESVQLFVDRARLARADFQITDRNASTLASICQRLDGIPLAIELAAARVGSLSVDQIDARLNQRFKLLTRGSRTAVPRQQTLRSMVDWSYDLLQNPERLAWQRLSVFAGGWTLPAAEQVCAGDGVDEEDVLDLLTSLCDKSLVVVEHLGGERTRYRLLETMRQYAHERLSASEHADRVCARHRDHYLALASAFADEQYGADQAGWLNRLELEHENLRSALLWSVDASNARAAMRICAALQRFWWTRGHLVEAREWCARVLRTSAAACDTPEYANLLSVSGSLAYYQGEYEAALAYHRDGLEIYRRLGHARGIAMAVNNLGNASYELGDYESARSFREEALALHREMGDRAGVAIALNNLGNALAQLGDYQTAEKLLRESLKIDRDLQDHSGIAITLGNLGDYASEQGNYAAAKALYEEGLAIKRQLGDQRAIAITLSGLANVFIEQGDLPGARALSEESLKIRREVADRGGIVYSLEGLAAVIAAEGDPLRAGCLWGAARRLREEIRAPLPPNERPRYTHHVDAARAAVGDDLAFERAVEKGRAMALSEAIDLATRAASQSAVATGAGAVSDQGSVAPG